MLVLCERPECRQTLKPLEELIERFLPLLWSLSVGVYVCTHLLNGAFMLRRSIECILCLIALQLFMPSGLNGRQLLGFNTHFAQLQGGGSWLVGDVLH